MDVCIRVGQKYEKSYSNLAQMFSSVKFRAEQFSFSKLFDSRPSSFPKLHFYFYKGILPKIQREILEFYFLNFRKDKFLQNDFGFLRSILLINTVLTIPILPYVMTL